jgi:uncharacterized protein YbjT (DUF2867 family)
MKTALVIGATGMVGSSLVNQLLSDDYFSKLIIFTRRSLRQPHPKLQEHIIDFDATESWQGLVKGDVLFSCLGTTLKTAGSKEVQYKIDYTYQYNFARAAQQNGVTHYVLISAAYSSPHSKIFYSRMKGELDVAVQHLNFPRLTILKPGQLTGDRKEKRLGERFSIALLSAIHHIPGLQFLKPIPADTVAKAMIVAAKQQSEHQKIYALKEIFELAEK